jgi:hypothetical protein
VRDGLLATYVSHQKVSNARVRIRAVSVEASAARAMPAETPEWFIVWFDLPASRPRRGQYRNETMIARFGGDVLMPDMRHLIA